MEDAAARQEKPKSASIVRPDTLLASVVVLLLVNVVQRSIGFGRGLLFCRWLDPESLGHWDMAYGFLLLAAPLAVLGLPGSFGRYLERFRQRGQLRVFLLRTTCWTALLGVVAVVGLAVYRRPFAYLVFGDSDEQTLLLLVACTLATVILHHFLEAVFAGLRVFRVVSAMHFAQSMLFAALSLALLATWRADAWSIVVGYGGACLLSSIGVLVWARRLDWDGAEQAAAAGHREFWPPLLRFAVWVWISALLSNLFSVIDRYMIVHYSGLSADESLALVGHYHTSMLVPVLLVSVANLLTGAMTPHLSHDWEKGDRAGVSARLNMAFKVASIAMLLAGIGVLLVAPKLFSVAFGGKYDEGLYVLPWTLAACVWFSLLLISQMYVWCAEKSRHASAPLAIGLVANASLNLMLLPRLGLQGAVVATALATLLALLLQLAVNVRQGMAPSLGVALVALAPLGLTQGATLAITWTAVVGVIATFTPWVFSAGEKQQMFHAVGQRMRRWIPRTQKTLVQESS